MKFKIIAALIILGGVFLYAVGSELTTRRVAPMVVSQIIDDKTDAQTVVSVSLKAVQQQNRLTPLRARYVAVVTSTETRLGMFTSRKTLIMPGQVRYEIDLAKLRQRDLDWNPKTHVLKIALPAVEIGGLEIDVDGFQNYTDGALTAFSGVSEGLDERNRKIGRMQLLAQARDPQMMKQAHDAAARSLEQMFAMPLRAAGLKAIVEVS